MKAEKLNLENVIRELRKSAERSLAPLQMIDMLTEENAELKKSLSWYEKKFNELKAKATQVKKL